MLASAIRNWWIYRIILPIENTCISLGITPNQLTILGFLANCFAALAFYNGYFFLGGTIIVLAGNLDFLDGRVARRTGQVSTYGGYLDSVLDRYTDSILFIGLAGYFHESWVLFVILLALFGSIMVSYTRAKAEAIGVPCKVGLMQRAERIFYLGAGAILSSFVTTSLMPFVEDPEQLPHYVLITILGIIAILANATAIYRIWHVITYLARQQSGNEP
ncbi:MAG: hypothetical protein A2284_09580 [Deltaproteobacteria bacterium RIFOXYA12_FULL_61_11]|nr:MAG: hypothetical protein A2284_09580 [Deltaproteobacteria bacterium RIFOXYA12_FULL_61_11]